MIARYVTIVLWPLNVAVLARISAVDFSADSTKVTPQTRLMSGDTHAFIGKSFYECVMAVFVCFV